MLLFPSPDEILLFRDARTHEYNDPGGKIDPGETAVAAAKRELREESIGLFSLNLSRARSLHFKSQRHDYTAYVVHFSSVNKMYNLPLIHRFYGENRDLSRMQHIHIGPEWRETDKVRRFFVDDILESHARTRDVESHAKTTRDVEGHSHVVGARVHQMLKLYASEEEDTTASAVRVVMRGIGAINSAAWKATKGKIHCYT